MSEKRKVLPICSPEQAKRLEACIIRVKGKAGTYKVNSFAVCRSSLKCRIGGSEKYEAKVGEELPAKVQDAIEKAEDVMNWHYSREKNMAKGD